MAETELELLKARLAVSEAEVALLKAQVNVLTEKIDVLEQLGNVTYARCDESTFIENLLMVLIEKIGYRLTLDEKITAHDLLYDYQQTVKDIVRHKVQEEHLEAPRDLIEAQWKDAAERQANA